MGPDVAGFGVNAKDGAKALGEAVQLRPVSMQQIVVVTQPRRQVLMMDRYPDPSCDLLGFVKRFPRHCQQLFCCHIMVKILQWCCHWIECGVQCILQKQYTYTHIWTENNSEKILWPATDITLLLQFSIQNMNPHLMTIIYIFLNTTNIWNRCLLRLCITPTQSLTFCSLGETMTVNTIPAVRSEEISIDRISKSEHNSNVFHSPLPMFHIQLYSLWWYW